MFGRTFSQMTKFGFFTSLATDVAFKGYAYLKNIDLTCPRNAEFTNQIQYMVFLYGATMLLGGNNRKSESMMGIGTGTLLSLAVGALAEFTINQLSDTCIFSNPVSQFMGDLC